MQLAELLIILSETRHCFQTPEQEQSQHPTQNTFKAGSDNKIKGSVMLTGLPPSLHLPRGNISVTCTQNRTLSLFLSLIYSL